MARGTFFRGARVFFATAGAVLANVTPLPPPRTGGVVRIVTGAAAAPEDGGERDFNMDFCSLVATAAAGEDEGALVVVVPSVKVVLLLVNPSATSFRETSALLSTGGVLKTEDEVLAAMGSISGESVGWSSSGSVVGGLIPDDDRETSERRSEGFNCTSIVFN